MGFTSVLASSTLLGTDFLDGEASRVHVRRAVAADRIPRHPPHDPTAALTNGGSKLMNAIGDFFAYSSAFSGGVFVAGGAAGVPRDVLPAVSFSLAEVHIAPVTWESNISPTQDEQDLILAAAITSWEPGEMDRAAIAPLTQREVSIDDLPDERASLAARDQVFFDMRIDDYRWFLDTTMLAGDQPGFTVGKSRALPKRPPATDDVSVQPAASPGLGHALGQAP